MALMVAFQVKQHARLILTVGGLYAVLWAAVALSPWLWLSSLLFFALGAADGVWAVTRNTLAQLLVPDTLRGRAMSMVLLVTRGSWDLGRVQSGLLVDLFGATAAVLAGAAMIAASIARAWRVPLPSTAGEPPAER